MQPPVGYGARVHPRSEDSADRAPQLLLRFFRERVAELLGDEVLEPGYNRPPILCGEIGIECDTGVELVVFEELFEMILDAEHDLPVHLDEASIAVIGEALVAALPCQPRDGPVVEPEVEHGVHHARHRDASSGAHRDEQRVVGVSEPCPKQTLDRGEPLGNLLPQLHRIGFAVRVEVGADAGRDCETRRHRQAEIAHLGEAGPLSAEQILHLGAALRRPVAKPVDPFCHPRHAP